MRVRAQTTTDRAGDGRGASLAWLEAWGRGDAEAVLGVLDPAVEIHSPQEVGNAGTYRGVGGYRKWEGLWMEAWDDFQNEILRVEPGRAATCRRGCPPAG